MTVRDMDPSTTLHSLQVRHPDGRLEPLAGVACRLRGSVLDSLAAALPDGAVLVAPGEHRPATAFRHPADGPV